MQRRKVDHILCGVFDLLRRERTAQPVRARLAFGKLDAGELAHEFLVTDAGAEPGKRGRDLRVVQLCNAAWHWLGQRFEIFARAVHDANARRVGEHFGKRQGDHDFVTIVFGRKKLRGELAKLAKGDFDRATG